MSNGGGYGKLIFVLIASFFLDLLLVGALNDIVKMGWSTAVIIGVVIYMVLVAVLADIADRLMP